jgi:8-oxo-dGTP diphosphatase
VTAPNPDRRRVGAVIIRDGHVLMVRERRTNADGRHLGTEYWTLPGGGVEAGESPADAVVREVAEETGLTATAISFLWEYAYPSGWTDAYAVVVENAEPRLGVDADLTCDCPRMVGLDWIALPAVASSRDVAVPTLLVAAPDPRSP